MSTQSTINLEKIKEIVFAHFPKRDMYSNETEFHTTPTGAWVAAQTKDRGPRTDHGGGHDGDGWMDDSQISSVAAPYKKKWQPKIDAVVKAIEDLGYSAKGYFEYGEKGHVGAQFTIEYKNAPTKPVGFTKVEKVVEAVPTLAITHATYGTATANSNVTEKVKEGLKVTNRNLGGDPAPGVKKTLTVTYTLNGTEHKKEFSEGQTVNF